MPLIYITCKDKVEAKKISKHLLEKRLIACANIFPIESMYWWKGEIEEANESVIIAKGFDFEKIKEETKKVHSYDVPAIIKIEADSNEEYMDWARVETENNK